MAEREVHLRDYLAVIREHSFVAVVSFLLIFGSALIVSLYIPRVYEAAATIEVQPTTEPSALPSLMQDVMSRGVDQVSMETICKRFISRSLLSETIRNLKRAMPEEMSGYLDTPDALAPRVRARIVPDTRMIEVAVRVRRDEGGSERAVRTTNELISVIQSHRSARTGAEMERRQNFVDGKIDEYETRIDRSNQDIEKFLESSGGPLAWSSEADHLITRLSNLMDLKERVETLMAAGQKRLHELRSRLEAEPEWVEYSRTFTQDTLWDKYRLDLAELKERLAAASTDFGKKNPRVQSLEAQIENIEDEMKNVAQEIMSAKTESRNPTQQSLLDQIMRAELDLISYEVQLELVEDMLDELDGERERVFSELAEKQYQLEKMRRDVGYESGIYGILLEKKLESEILASENVDNSSGMVKGGIEIVDMAQPGSRPVSPRVKFIGAIAGLVGLVVSLAMAFLAEYFENTYQSLEEAREDLDIPILGAIPFVKDKELSMLPVLVSPTSAEAESFRSLVTNIELSSPETPYRSLLITSGGAEEGKSFVAANLAVAMAQTKGRVILVDCDMRKAIQHEIFDVDNETGLVNVLAGNADLELIIRDTGVPNLHLISCGPMPPNSVGLLNSGRMQEILRDLKEAYDVVLCDSPPVLPVADALILASRLDGILLLADLNHTPREVIRQAREQLSKLDVPLLGLICNKVVEAKYGSYYHYKSSVREFVI